MLLVPFSADIPDLLGNAVLQNPDASVDQTYFFTPKAIIIQDLWAVVRGTTPSVTWTIRYDTDRSAAGTEVITGGTVTTSESGVNITSFNNPNIPADSWVWIETTTQSGTVAELSIAISGL